MCSCGARRGTRHGICRNERRGTVLKAYHAYPAGNYEHISFPECIKYITYPVGTALPLDDKKRMKIINGMDVNYMTLDLFKGIENRNELTDEEKAVAKRFRESIKNGLMK